MIRGHTKYFFRILFFNFIAVSAVVLTAELIFGTWLGDNFGSLNIPRETIRFDASDLYAGGEDIRYQRDQYGFRGKYGSPASLDILTIGGSTTDQKALTEGETWQDYLAEAFKSDGQDITVANAGIDGQSTIGHIFNFERWFPLIPELHPRFVVAYVGINDVHVWMEDTADQLLAHSRVLRIHHAIKNNSAIYKLYRVIKGQLVARKARLTGADVKPETAGWTDTPNLPVDPEFVKKIASYSIRLKKLVGKIRDLDATPILVTQQRGDMKIDKSGKVWGMRAPKMQRNGIDEALALNQINAATLETCRVLEITCFDLATEIVLNPTDFYDRVHTKPSGAKKIGLYLHRKLKAEIQVNR